MVTSAPATAGPAAGTGTSASRGTAPTPHQPVGSSELPGPLDYGTPSVASVKPRGPAYSIGGGAASRRRVYLTGEVAPAARAGVRGKTGVAADTAGTGGLSPGPAHYAAQGMLATKRKAPAFSMGRRPGTKNTPATPGPGAYQHGTAGKAPRKTGSGATPGKAGKAGKATPTTPRAPTRATSATTASVRAKSKQSQAGAGGAEYYSLPDPWTSKGRGFTMQGKAKPAPSPGLSPDPGAYDVAAYKASGNTRTNSSPGYTMRPRTPARDPPNTPGPGANRVHDAWATKPRAPAYTMGGKAKEPSRKAQQPEPTSYSANLDSDSRHRSGPKVSMGRAKRPTSAPSGKKRRTSKLGPGSYEVQSSFGTKPRAPAYTMGGKAKEPSRKAQQPEPTSYSANLDSDSRHRSGPKVSMGRAKRPTSAPSPEKRRTSKLGPGSYEVQSSFGTKPRAPAYTMGGKAKEPSRKAQQPEPTSYSANLDSDSRHRSPPKVSMGRAKRPTSAPSGEKRRTSKLGPGSYEVQSSFGTKPRAPAYTMGGKAKEPSRKAQQPEPTSYSANLDSDSRHRSPPKVSMGRAKRPTSAPSGEKRRTSKLGPGSYEVQSSFGTKPRAPAYTMGGRPEAKKGREAAPPVGAYNPQAAADGRKTRQPSFSMGRRLAGPKSDVTPDPGAYDPSIDFESRHSSPPKASLAPRSSVAASSLQGPREPA